VRSGKRSLTVLACLSDSADQSDEKPRMTPEGFAAFRERQRLKWNGAPLSEWSKSAWESVPDQPDHEPVPPTPDQQAAADLLFETRLRDEHAPDGFGDGLDELGI
jgi:hypothetical protein